MNLSDKDISQIVAYVDGDMSEAERSEFERRLATDAELAAAAEQFWQTDDLMRRARAQSSSERPRLRRLAPIAAVLAAAAALLLIMRVGFTEGAELRAVGVLEPAERWVTPPPAPSTRAGTPGATEADMREWFDTYLEEQSQAVRLALDSTSTLSTSREFFVAVDLAAEASVVIWAQSGDVPPWRLYPESEESKPTALTLPPGTHVLPESPMALVENILGGTVPVALRRAGFSLPASGSYEVTVCVFKKPADDFLGRLDSSLESIREEVPTNHLVQMLDEWNASTAVLSITVDED